MGVRDATRPGPRCIQDRGNDPEFGRHTDEDCLTLNVWTPSPSNEKRPVMVWIHGGAFVNGSGAIYDARWLSGRGDLVVVTLNYRLGALGFLAHPALGPPGRVGNYGLADQQAALRWVRDNIANFGGDPAKVTIAGESAGGMAVCDHLVAPDSAKLFRAAIIQSGPCQAQADLPTAEKVSRQFAAELGCNEAAGAAQCLRALPAGRLEKAPLYVRFGSDSITGPVTGTAALPDPMTAFADGRAARVPVMIGSNRDEGTLFAAKQFVQGLGGQFAPDQYPQLLSSTFGDDADAVAAQYPTDRFGGSVPLAYSAAATDGVFACSADRIADDLATTAPFPPVYFYEFNDPDAPAPETLRTLPFPVGASHSLELRYLFDVGGTVSLNPAQQRLSEQMIEYWSRFVATGSPGADWPELGDAAAAGRVMSLQPDGSRVVTDFAATHRCSFWASLNN